MVQLWRRFLSNSYNKQSLIEFLTKDCNFEYRHFFCHIAESWLASCNWWRKQEIFQSQVTVNFPTCPGWDLNPGSGERQLAWQCICRGLVVTMPGSQAWVRRFESPLDPEAGWPGRYINVWCCGGLSMVLLPLKDPQGTIREEKGISSQFRVSIWPKLLKAT